MYDLIILLAVIIFTTLNVVFLVGMMLRRTQDESNRKEDELMKTPEGRRWVFYRSFLP